MWNPFGWVVNLFKHADRYVQLVVQDVKTFVRDAGPIVAALGNIAKTLPQSQFVAEVEKVVAEYEKDSSVVAEWLNSIAGFTSNEILKSAALAALKAVVPSIGENYASIAIELALAVLKLQAPAQPQAA